MSRIGTIVGLIAAVVAIGIAIGLLAGRSSVVVAPPGVPAADTNGTVAAGNSGPGTTAQPKPTPRKSGAAARMAESGLPVTTAAASSQVTNWEERVEQILGDDNTSDSQKVQQMAAMFPNLNAEAQEEVAQHMTNLTPDEDYGILSQYLVNAELPEAVLEVFLADVLNRPNSVKMPLLLEVAKNQQHPSRSEAVDLMELFLEEDYGQDWNKWQAKMQEWLKENPDE